MKTTSLNLLVLVLALTLSVSKAAVSNIQSEANSECGDSIVFKSGSTVKAKIIETDAYDIKYKRCANLNGPTISAPKNSISMVKYTNGSVESFKNSAKRPRSNSDSVTMKHRYIGLGIRAGGLSLSDLMSSSVPPFRIVANIDPIKYIRLEFQYGLYKNTNETWASTPTGTVTLNPIEKSSIISFGAMALYPVGHTRFIVGGRYGINKYSSDNVYYPPTWPSTPYLVNDYGTRTIISGVLGGEYFFGKCFSVGAEFNFLSIKDVQTSAAVYNTPTATVKTIMSEGCLMFRFYPL